MTTCPTCGQRLPRIGERQLYDVLLNGVPHREVYLGRYGCWYVTYSGGEVNSAAVAALVNAGKIASVYSSIPNEVYHVGRTLDCERTLERRRREGKKAPLVYVSDP